MGSAGVARARVGTVLVVLLVVTAGCTVGGGAGGDGVQGTSDGAGSVTASSGAGGSDGASDSSGGTTAEAGGSSDGGGDEPVTLEDAHEAYASNLRESGSYTVTYTWSMEGEEAAMNGSFEGVARIDLESESAYMVQTVLDGSGEPTTVELFWPAGEDVVYTRYDTGEGSFYQTSPRNQSALTLWTDPFVGTGSVTGSGTGVDTGLGTDTVGAYRDEGIVSTAEGPRRRYVVDDLPTAGVEASSDGEVGEFYAEVLVDEERDIVTDYHLRMTSAETSAAGFESFDFELAYRDVGSTTVPTPEWLTEAKAQAG